MSDSVLINRPRPAETRATDFATWEATHIRVSDIDRALRFWHDLLGLRISRTSTGEIALGVEDAELVVLHPGARRPSPRGHAGLYHVALHLPSARDFAEMLVRLLSRGVDPRPTDHLLHWAMYLSDGDRIGVELSFETADRFDRVLPGADAVFLGTDGREHGPVEASTCNRSSSPFSPWMSTARCRPGPGSATITSMSPTWQLPRVSTNTSDSGRIRPSWVCATSAPAEASCTASRSTSGKVTERLRPPSPPVDLRRRHALQQAKAALDRDGSPLRELEGRPGVSVDRPVGAAA